MIAWLGAAREQCGKVDSSPRLAVEAGKNPGGDARAVDGDDGVAGEVGVVEGLHERALGGVDGAAGGLGVGREFRLHADLVAGVVGETGQRGFRFWLGSIDHAADGELGETAARGGAGERVEAVDVAAEHDGVFAAEEVEEFVALRTVFLRGKLMPRGACAVGDVGRVKGSRTGQFFNV